MPIYEYACQECRREILGLGIESTQSQRGHLSALRRLADWSVSCLDLPLPSPRKLDSNHCADPANLGGIDENDPRSVARLMKKMGQEMGEDVDDIEAMMDQSDDGAGMPEGSDGL